MQKSVRFLVLTQDIPHLSLIVFLTHPLNLKAQKDKLKQFGDQSVRSVLARAKSCIKQRLLGQEGATRLRLIETWKLNIIAGTQRKRIRDAQQETREAMQAAVNTRFQHSAIRAMSKATRRLTQCSVRARIFYWRTQSGDEKFSVDAMTQLEEAKDRSKILAYRIKELKEAPRQQGLDSPDSNWLFPRSPPNPTPDVEMQTSNGAKVGGRPAHIKIDLPFDGDVGPTSPKSPVIDLVHNGKLGEYLDEWPDSARRVKEELKDVSLEGVSSTMAKLEIAKNAHVHMSFCFDIS